MPGRMPILCEDHAAEIFRKPVDDRHNFIAARHSHSAARTEVVLHIDHDEDIAVADCVSS